MKQLARQNFIRFKDCYVARVYWSKTIQFHDKCLDILMLPNPDLRLCPIYWLDRFFCAVPARPSDSDFAVNVSESCGGGVTSVNYAQLTYWLKEWVEAIGLSKELFSSHSLRRGAQWGAQCKLPYHMIKLIGDWKSQAYKRYLNLTLQECYDATLIFNMSM